VIWQAWHTFLDSILVLDETGQRHETIYRNLDEKESKQHAFLISYAAFLAQYRYALEFITLMENDPAMHTMLSEAVPELGLQPGSYTEIKYRFLNVIRGAEFVRLYAVYQLYGQDDELVLNQGIEQDRKAIWQQGVSNGLEQTAKNALKIILDAGFSAWFPLQKGVSEWMGDG